MFSDSFKVEKLKLNELKVSRKAGTESKTFPFKHFHDNPKLVFSFFGLSVSLFFFLSFRQVCSLSTFSPLMSEVSKK